MRGFWLTKYAINLNEPRLAERRCFICVNLFYSGERNKQIGLFSPLLLLTKNYIMKRIIFICLFSLFWSSVAISEPELIDSVTMIRKQLVKDYEDAAYATIRGFVLKLKKLGLLTGQSYGNKVKYKVKY